MLLALVAAVALQAVTPQDTSSAYLDPGARELVRQARLRRETAARQIAGYHVFAKERISLGLRALRFDRLFYRRELAAHISWHRDAPDTVTMDGAREAIPVALSKAQVPENLKGDAPDLAFDPANERIGSGLSESSYVRHPLASTGERDYRFQSGDTTSITLPNGKTVRLYELRVIPRRDEFRLLAGSFWFEGDSFSVVRAIFRPARAFDLEQDADSGDTNDVREIPGFLKPIRAEVRYITIEYALWDGRWWLPRLLAMDGVATMGSFIEAPLKFERTYSDYRVEGDTGAPGPRVAVAADDSAKVACQGRANCHCEAHRCRAVTVIVPTDTAALLASPALPASILDNGEGLMTRSELTELGARLRLIPQAPWQPHKPTFNWGLGRAGLIRFNRVEGLSLGARGEWSLSRVTLDGTARVALSDGQPDLELGLVRSTSDNRFRLAFYRRLNGVDPAARSLGFGNSANALLLGRDDGDYFRSQGVDFVVRPAGSNAQLFALRLFAEHQFAAPVRTDLSLPHLVHSSHVFRPGIAVQETDEVGMALGLKAARAVGGKGARVGLDVSLDAAVGRYPFARMAAAARAGAPIGAKLFGAVEAAAGTSDGPVPVQSLWYMGGPATLRGYGGAAAVGASFWRGRAELANRLPAARLAVFSDLAWAGSRNAFATSRPLVSAGVGASFLDGLIRVDLARALRAPKGWRLELYSDAIL